MIYQLLSASKYSTENIKVKILSLPRNENLTDTMPTILTVMTHDKPVLMMNKTDLCYKNNPELSLAKVQVTVPCVITATNLTEEIIRVTCENNTATKITEMNTICTDNKIGDNLGQTKYF